MAKDTYIDEELLEEIHEYCRLNGFNTTELINRWLKNAFTQEKWGSFPQMKEVKQELKTEKIEPVEPIKVRKPEDVPEMPMKEPDPTIPHLKQIKKRDLYGE
jgi:hypothetical protein